MTDMKTDGNPAETMSDGAAERAYHEYDTAMQQRGSYPAEPAIFVAGYRQGAASRTVSDASLVLMGPQVIKRLDHLDLAIHELSQQVTALADEFAPLARQAAKLMNNPVARHLRKRQIDG